jgi:molybdate transport system permease protein
VSALGLSLVTGALATLVCIVLGIPLALWIARSGPRLAGVLRAVVTVPLVLPPMVGGVALLFLLGRNGWLGQWLAVVGVRLPFTTAAVVIAQTFVALPFLVLAVEGPSVRRARATSRRRRRSARALAHPVAYHAAAGGSRPHRRHRAVLRARDRGVRRDGAVRRQCAGVTQTMPLAIYTAFNGAGCRRAPRWRCRCCCS